MKVDGVFVEWRFDSATDAEKYFNGIFRIDPALFNGMFPITNADLEIDWYGFRPDDEGLKIPLHFKLHMDEVLGQIVSAHSRLPEELRELSK